MTARRDVPALAQLQSRFAAALAGAADDSPSDDPQLLGAIVDDGLEPAARLRLYRNNSRAVFSGALLRSFPVVARRVGEGFFHRLAAEYRVAHPSRSGDLYWIGAAFPDWLAGRLAGTEYAWLADLARLERACEEVLVAPEFPAIAIEALGRIDPDALATTSVRLQPALRCVSSAYPVWSVWRANQPGEAGDPVVADRGPEHVVVTRADDRPVLHRRPEPEVHFVAALAAGRPLEQSLEVSALSIEALPGTLAWLFQDGLVVSLESRRPGTST